MSLENPKVLAPDAIDKVALDENTTAAMYLMDTLRQVNVDHGIAAGVAVVFLKNDGIKWIVSRITREGAIEMLKVAIEQLEAAGDLDNEPARAENSDPARIIKPQ